MSLVFKAGHAFSSVCAPLCQYTLQTGEDQEWFKVLNEQHAGKAGQSAGAIKLGESRRELAPGRRSRDILDRDDAEGAHLVILLADRHIFAGSEALGREPIARFIGIVVTVNIIVKRPGAAWPVHEMADLVRLPLPEAADPALIAVLLPFGGIEAVFMVEGAVNS